MRTAGIAVLAIAVLVSTGSVFAQQAPPPAAPPASGQPAPAVPGAATAAPGSAAAAAALAFTGDAGFVLFTVKADGASDFESFFAKVKEALAQGTNPQYKQMAAGWKLFKVTEGTQPGQVLYASIIDPAVTGVDYDPVKILSDVMPADAAALYPKLKDALLSVNRLNLTVALTMGM
jgi:hypothetical protein